MITQRSTTGSLRSSGIVAPGEIVRLFLGAGGAREEREERLARRLSLEQDRGDLRDHRRGDPRPVREREPGLGGAHPFRDRASAGLPLGERLPARQGEPEPPVPRELPGAREDEVAEPGEPREGARARAQRDARGA